MVHLNHLESHAFLRNRRLFTDPRASRTKGECTRSDRRRKVVVFAADQSKESTKELSPIARGKVESIVRQWSESEPLTRTILDGMEVHRRSVQIAPEARSLPLAGHCHRLRLHACSLLSVPPLQSHRPIFELHRFHSDLRESLPMKFRPATSREASTTSAEIAFSQLLSRTRLRLQPRNVGLDSLFVAIVLLACSP